MLKILFKDTSLKNKRKGKWKEKTFSQYFDGEKIRRLRFLCKKSLKQQQKAERNG